MVDYSDLPDDLGLLVFKFPPYPGDDAYDGSNEPQLRELTARERDVLCGVITDIECHVRRGGKMVATPLRVDQEWLTHLLIIRHIIDPRRETDDER